MVPNVTFGLEQCEPGQLEIRYDRGRDLWPLEENANPGRPVGNRRLFTVSVILGANDGR